uniref:Cyclin N-terminal domain-containing protein n=1 Tax=Arcella intermedia TaxID=1963864 RepID=A0A6B2LD21_9EUKA
MTNLISAPDVKEIVICLSRVLYWNIRNHSKMEKRFYPEIFSETKFPLGDGKTNFTIIPTEDEILEFLVMIFSGQDLGAECGVMTAVYIDRLNKLTGIKFCPENWRRIVLGALMLASKVSEDSGVWNVDYLYSFPNISLKDLNRLETEYLICLKFTVSLTATVYARYYFELRSLSEMNEENFPVKPLDQQRAVLLERISKGMEQKAKRKRSGRSLSMDWNSYRPAGRVTLEQFQNRFCKKWQTWEENG